MKFDDHEYVIDFTIWKTEAEWRAIVSNLIFKFTDIFFKYIGWVLLCGALRAAYVKTDSYIIFTAYIVGMVLIVMFLFQFFAFRMFIKISNSYNLNCIFTAVIALSAIFFASIGPLKVANAIAEISSTTIPK